MANEIANVDRKDAVMQGSGVKTTLPMDTREEKLAVMAALTDAVQIDPDHLGKKINLAHVIMQDVQLLNKATGEMEDNVRIVLVDDKGKGYAATSIGLYGSLRDLFAIMGNPASWDAPIPIQVINKRGNNGYSFMKISYVI